MTTMEIGKYICDKCLAEIPITVKWNKNLKHGDLVSDIAFLIAAHIKTCT